MSMLDGIWKPDTYIWNGQRSYLHKITRPNRLVRLKFDGHILYSQRSGYLSKPKIIQKPAIFTKHNLQTYNQSSMWCTFVSISIGYANMSIAVW